MTVALTHKGEFVRREMNKLLTAVSGIAIFAFLTVLPLWRGCLYSPNAKFSAVIYSLPGLGLYVATVVVIARLKKRLADFEPGQPSAPPN
jgi:hypothetical protein